MAWTWWICIIWLSISLYIYIHPMIFLSYHHGFRGTPPQLCRLGSSLSSSWGWRCCCPCWVSPRRSHRSRACSRRGRLGFAARFGQLMCLCEFLWNSFDSFLILVERFLFFWDFWGIKGGLFRRYWGISWGSKVHPAGVGMIRLSVADHLEDAKGQFFSGPGWWLSNVAFYFLISGGFQGHKVLFIEELQGVFWWFFFACENLKSSHTFMGHPFITQWTPHITQLNQLNGMVFPGKNSLSFGDPLHVMPLVGAAVSTPRLARRADLDQLCRFDSVFFFAQFLLLVQQGEKIVKSTVFFLNFPVFCWSPHLYWWFLWWNHHIFPDKMSRFFARLWFREYGDSTLDLNFRVQWESNAGGHRWGFLT